MAEASGSGNRPLTRSIDPPTFGVLASGFAEVYGDYGEVGITSAGKTVAVWGEGASYTGPGGAWFNRQL